ncbi:MAG: M16 family metallopeptidase [Planctomycetota bacterium]|jgi:predicted Zn-dependent peptidase
MKTTSLAAAALLAPALLLASPPSASADPGEDFKVPVKEGMLENGMKVLVVERSSVPTMACMIKFRVGAVDEQVGTTGIAHILEHMLFKGTPSIGTTNYEAEKPLLDRTEELYTEIRSAWNALPLEIRRNTEVFHDIIETAHSLGLKMATPADRMDDKVRKEITELQRKAESLRALGGGVGRVFDLEKEFCEVQEEADQYVIDDEDWMILERNGAWGLNASTGADSTQYFYNLPANRLELWALIESGRMRHPVLRQFYKERDVIMEERRMRIDNDPGGRMWEQMGALAFGAHPYHWPVIGWASDIRWVSRTEVEDFFRKYYAPNRAVACIVGDVKFDDVMKMVEKYFGDIPRQKDPDPVRTIEPPQLGAKRGMVEQENLEIPQLAVAFHRPAIGHPDFYVLDVITGILSTGNSSRLRREVTLAGIGQLSTYNGDSLYPDLFAFMGSPNVQQGKTLGDLEAAVKKQIERLKNEPVAEQELKRIRKQNAAGMVRNMQSNMGLARTLTSYEVLHEWQYINTYQKEIEKVTAEDILRVARKYFTEKNSTTVHLVPKEKPEQ